MNRLLSPMLTSLLFWSGILLPVNVFPQGKLFTAVAQNNQAVIYAPPSNIRKTPNGQILCSIKVVTNIETYGYSNGWYKTFVCGSEGYIHESQIRFQNVSESATSTPKCLVVGIATGQLAVRKSPGGESIAGLNNDNLVQYIKGEFPWYYIKVINGPNSKVNGKTGWVNANYLECAWD